MLDLSLLEKPKDLVRRATHDVKRTGIVGGACLLALSALKEHSAMCRNQLSEETGMTRDECSRILIRLAEYDMAEKTGAKVGNRYIYKIKDWNSDE